MTSSSIRTWEEREIETITFPVADVHVDAVASNDIQKHLPRLLEREGTAYVCCCNVNMVVRANRDERVAEAVNGADLVVPDGRPIAAIGDRRSDVDVDRVRGTDLLRMVCSSPSFEGRSHLFYGGGEGVAESVADELAAENPSLDVAGARCPPFGDLSQIETDEEFVAIGEADPDILWVALGCPKQELWMHRNREHLGASLVIGVGAAFDFVAGTKPEAPKAVGERAEFAWRLVTDPSGTWRRVFVEGPIFAYLLAKEKLAGGAASRR